MSVILTPRNIFGSVQYEDKVNKIIATKIDNVWYPSKDGLMFDAGFCNIQCMSDFLDKYDQYQESLSMMGFNQCSLNEFSHTAYPHFQCNLTVENDGIISIDAEYKNQDNQIKKFRIKSDDFTKIENYLIKLLDSSGIDIFCSVALLSKNDKFLEVIEAKSKKGMPSRDLSKNLVRVKSSNIWSWGINVRDRKDKVGDMVIQFKDKNGGPGDLYLYYDVPATLYRKLQGQPSKGHAFWQYIRNNFGYRKLTGDKKGKLPNAIN